MGAAADTATIVRFEPEERGASSADVSGSTFVVDLDEIEPSEHHGRLTRNPKWHEIKAAISTSGGLTHALPVTRRPGAGRYVVHQGGNTRLLVLKELDAEAASQDHRFRRVSVEYHPYTSELDLAALHDRENSCRGDLTFIEQALAKQRMFELFCTSGLTNKPTARAFVDHVRRTYGDPLTAEAFSRMKFTAEVLYPRIPTCLVHGGMSQRAVRHLIGLRERLTEIWLDRGIGSKPEFESIFYDLLQRQDEDLAVTYRPAETASGTSVDSRLVIDWRQFASDLQHEITMAIDVDFHRVGVWLAPAFQNMDAAPLPGPSWEATSPAPVVPRRSSKPVAQPSLEACRAQCHRIAARLARHGGIEDLVVATPDIGFGYAINGAPRDAEDLSGIARACWWALIVACSPVTSSQATGADALTAPSLFHPTSKDQWNAVIELMGFPSVAALPAELWSLWTRLLRVQARQIDALQGRNKP